MDNIGKRFGLLTVRDRKREGKRTYYLCDCECGNSKWIRADVIKGGQKSCGCLMKSTQFKNKDITGNTYGKLTVLSKTDEVDKNNGSIIWKCKCECGSYKNVPAYELLRGSVRSCGCIQIDTMRENGKKVGQLYVDRNIIEGTNIQTIKRDKPMAHNTSGVTGVLWEKRRQKWKAEIIFKGKKYYLGRYENKQDAINARKEAEEKLHKKFLRDKNLL